MGDHNITLFTANSFQRIGGQMSFLALNFGISQICYCRPRQHWTTCGLFQGGGAPLRLNYLEKQNRCLLKADTSQERERKVRGSAYPDPPAKLTSHSLLLSWRGTSEWVEKNWSVQLLELPLFGKKHQGWRRRSVALTKVFSYGSSIN